MKFYQIYVRSFKDSNNDGIGDLRGIIDNYQSESGAIILSPIFKSENIDPSYDVIDYFTIDPIFGSIDDLKALIAHAHEKDIRVILDFIPNHTSDQHEWFRRSTAGDPDFEDFYVWHDGYPSKNIGRPTPPNNWVS